MSRWLRPTIVGSLLSGGVAFSCIVSNVELVDRLPGANDGGAGVAGTSSTDGGDDPGPPSGGKSSGGTSSAGSSNPGGGSGNPGGGSSNPGGGSSGGDGPLTDPTNWEFSGKGACETNAPAMLCDDFEIVRDSNWAGGLPGTRAVVTDAPSGSHIWRSAYMAAAMNVVPGGAGFNLSFWVRVPGDSGDHIFIHWSGPGHTPLTFGVEGGAYRFRLASEPMAYSAPELQKYTRNVRFDTWTCVELVYVDATFQATVAVLGEAPVKLALVGGTANEGIDQEILEQGASDAFDIGPEWTLGETGAEIDFDDVRVVPIGQPSVCQEFIDANNP